MKVMSRKVLSLADRNSEWMGAVFSVFEKNDHSSKFIEQMKSHVERGRNF